MRLEEKARPDPALVREAAGTSHEADGQERPPATPGPEEQTRLPKVTLALQKARQCSAQ